MTDLFDRNRERRKEREQEALEADRDRMDFLEKQRAFVSNRINVETGDQIWMITLPVYANEYSCRSYEGASPRAAIDKAMEATNQPK